MRKILFGLLLVGAAAPALAAGAQQDRDDNPRHHREERADRPQRDDRAQRGDRDQGQRPANAERPQFNPGQGRPDIQRPQFSGDGRRGPPMNGNVQQANDGARNWQGRDRQGQQGGYWQQRQDRQQGGYWQRQARDQGQYGATRYPQQRYGNNYTGRDRGDWTRQGRPSPFRVESNRSSRVNWNRDWRNDRRYDWRDRRYRHRSLFHLGLYIDPFGWGYQPYSIGYDLQPSYYQQNYWIDPAMYGLPYPPPGAQWVRYWNDAVLVDMYSGQIIDSIPGFFW